MEKYSAFRDPGTGIQPFLTPVPPMGSDDWTKWLLPIRILYGSIKMVVVIILAVLYAGLIHGVCILFLPIPFIHRIATRLITAVAARLVLLLAGCLWISVDTVSKRRGRGPGSSECWNPGAGAVIVSNWVSWIEILWLAFRFDPIFVLPVCDTVTLSPPHSAPLSPQSNRNTPGRRTGTGSAALSSAARAPIPRKPVLGFRRVSLLSVLVSTARVPPYGSPPSANLSSLEELCSTADRPLVLFPECTTSNGRALLRFADVFPGEGVPVKNFNLFIMCIRYDPPTALTSTPSLSIPSPRLNPLPHIFALTTNLVGPKVSIRLLAPSESPSSPLFVASEAAPGDSGSDSLSRICAKLVEQIGKLKSVSIGWEDKAAFLKLYQEKKKM